MGDTVSSSSYLGNFKTHPPPENILEIIDHEEVTLGDKTPPTDSEGHLGNIHKI